MKKCSGCDVIKPLSDFYKRSARCAACCRARQKQYYESHPEYRDAMSYGIKARFSKAKFRAKQRGIEWALTIDQYEQLCNQSCYFCKNIFGTVTTRTGLDRICSDRGYTAENVLPCCGHCNIMKHDTHTVEETLALVQLLIEMRRPKLHVVK